MSLSFFIGLTNTNSVFQMNFGSNDESKKVSSNKKKESGQNKYVIIHKFHLTKLAKCEKSIVRVFAIGIASFIGLYLFGQWPFHFKMDTHFYMSAVGVISVNISVVCLLNNPNPFGIKHHLRMEKHAFWHAHIQHENKSELLTKIGRERMRGREGEKLAQSSKRAIKSKSKPLKSEIFFFCLKLRLRHVPGESPAATTAAAVATTNKDR